MWWGIYFTVHLIDLKLLLHCKKHPVGKDVKANNIMRENRRYFHCWFILLANSTVGIYNDDLKLMYIFLGHQSNTKIISLERKIRIPSLNPQKHKIKWKLREHCIASLHEIFISHSKDQDCIKFLFCIWAYMQPKQHKEDISSKGIASNFKIKSILLQYFSCQEHTCHVAKSDVNTLWHCRMLLLFGMLPAASTEQSSKTNNMQGTLQTTPKGEYT